MSVSKIISPSQVLAKPKSLSDFGLPDPYHLFHYEAQEWPYKNFDQLLSECDLAQVDIEPQNNSADNSKVLPNFLHYLYVLNPISDTYKDMITAGKKQNPHYRFTLWVDKHVYKEEEFEKLKHWAKENSIHLIDVNSSIGNCLGDAGLLYQMEMKKRWPGSATDMLRLKIIDKVGGIYSDTTDILCKGKLSDNIVLPQGVNLCTFNRNTVEMNPLLAVQEMNAGGWVPTQQRPVFNNDWIAAVPGNEFIQKAIVGFQENYVKPMSQLLTNDYKNITTDTRLYRYGNYQNTPIREFTAKQLKFEWTKAMAGPNHLGEIIVNYSQEEIDSIENANGTDYPDGNKFLFALAGTWTANSSNPASKTLTAEEQEKNRQYHITFQLHQLVIEPRKIFFELYEHLSDLSHEQLLTRLFDEFRDSLKEVEYIQINWGSSTEAQTFSVETIEKILDPDFFPKLNYESILKDFNEAIPEPDKIIANLKEAAQRGIDGIIYRRSVAQYLYEYSHNNKSSIDLEELNIILPGKDNNNLYRADSPRKQENDKTDVALINSKLLPLISNYITNQITRLERAFFKNSMTSRTIEELKNIKTANSTSMGEFFDFLEEVRNISNVRHHKTLDKVRSIFHVPSKTKSNSEFDTLINQFLTENAHNLTVNTIESIKQILESPPNTPQSQFRNP